MTDKPKLKNHRKELARNPDAYVFELQDQNIDRLVKTLISHIKNPYPSISYSKSAYVLRQIIRLLFKAQDYRPFFHVEGTELPLCWNAPKDMDKNYIKYEWGHLHSRNQVIEEDNNIENLGLYSARCNQHIQTSMNIEELMIYGGILAQRISTVLIARRKLFESEEWKQLIAELQNDSG